MKNFNVEVYTKGCELTINIKSASTNTYCVLLNTSTKHVSDIIQYNGAIKYNVPEDGIYKLYIIQDSTATFDNGTLIVGGNTYNNKDLVDALDSNIIGFRNAIVDSDEIFCDCNLKKCLLALQLKVFNALKDNCGKKRCKVEELKSQRDFLFIAHWLLEHLAEEDKVEQMKSIYDGILRCGSICGNLLKTKDGCGCNSR